MKTILQHDKNQFLVITRWASLQVVIDLLRDVGDKLHYVVAETAAGDYAIFTSEEFVREWQQYQQANAGLSSPRIEDVPLFTAPRVSHLESWQAVTEGIEKRFAIVVAGAVAALLVQPRNQTRFEILSEPVLLKDLLEIDDSIMSGSIVNSEIDLQELPDIVIHSKGETHVYHRIADNEVPERLKAMPKDKLVTLLNRGSHVGAIEFFDGEGDLGLGLTIDYSKKRLEGIVDTNCPHCGKSVTFKGGRDKDKVLLIAGNLAEPREVSRHTSGAGVVIKNYLRQKSFWGIPEVAPETTGRSFPEVAPEPTRRSPHVAREIETEIRPGIIPEVAPEVRPEVRPEIAPELADYSVQPGKPVEKRWINVELEGDANVLLVNQVYTLSFDVDLAVRDTSVARDVEFRYSFEEAETGVELEVHLSSQDFKIYDDRQKLYVPRIGKSENKARFDIKPLHDRPGTLKALILKDNNFVQELTLTIEAGKIQVKSKGRPPEAATIIKPRDVHLDISYDNGRFELKFISGFVANASIDLSPQAVEKLGQEVRDVWDRIIAKKSSQSLVYQVGVDIPERINKDSLKKLAEAGSRLFKKLFYENQDKQTQAMGNFLRKMAHEESLQIQITSDKFFLPWGVLYMALNVDNPEADMFLGLKHIIEHIPKQKDFKDFSLQINGNPKFSVSLNLDERIDEEAAAKGVKNVVAEQVEFWDRLKAFGSIEPVVRRKSTDLLDVVGKHAMDERLIYFYCHASARMDKSKPSITLGDGKTLSVDDLSDKEGELMSLPSAPLVFVNACDSAELSPFFYDDFLNFFVSRGARGAIGTECKIPAVFASEWANRFFRRFLPGKSLGELFLELRREFYYEHNNLLGLAYALYCDGDTQILPGLTIGEAIPNTH